MTIRIMQVGIALFYVLFLLLVFTPQSYAETKAQMWNRVLTEWEQKHPDIISGCDSACVSKIITANPWLPALAQMTSQSVERHAKAYQSFSFDKGLEFEKLYKRPPTLYDWTAMFTDNAEAWRAKFDVGQAVFAVNDWDARRYFRFTWTMCDDSNRKQAKCW